MSKNIDFQVGTLVTDVFLDAIQELQTGSMNNLRLAPSGLGTDRIAVEVDGDIVNDKRATANVGGKYVYTDATKDSDPSSSGAGLKEIYMSTSASSPSEPDFDLTVGSAPAASYLRKIGEATRTGSQLHNVRLLNGNQIDADQYNAMTFRSVMDYNDETILAVEGQSTQLSTAASNVADPSATPTKALSVGENGNEHFYVDTLGRIVFPDNGGDGDAALQYNVFNTVSGISTNRQIVGNVDAGTDVVFGARTDGDAENRLQILGDGTLELGNGTNPVDFSLAWSSAGIAAVAAGGKLQQNEPPTVGDDLTNKTYVDGEIAAESSTSRRFAFFIGR